MHRCLLLLRSAATEYLVYLTYVSEALLLAGYIYIWLRRIALRRGQEIHGEARSEGLRCEVRVVKCRLRGLA